MTASAKKIRVSSILLLFFFLSFTSTSTLFAGVTGRLKGKVSDLQNDAPLPNVLITITGTGLKTITDEKGEFFFIAVDAGTYSITASSEWYAKCTFTGTTVFPDHTAELFFKLNREENGNSISNIVFEKPFPQIKKPFSFDAITQSEFSHLPVHIIDDVILNTSGSIYRHNERSAFKGNRYTPSYYYIPREGFADYEEASVNGLNNIHVRGGLASELGYYMDGILLNDPFTGKNFSQIPFQAIDHVTLYSGGFGAKYGEFNAGIAQIIPKRAGERITASGELVTDAAAPLLGAYSYGNQLYSLSLSGPIVKDQIQFFVAADLSKSDDAEPSFLGS